MRTDVSVCNQTLQENILKACKSSDSIEGHKKAENRRKISC